MAKRGLFQSIFGGKSEKNKDFHAYKLLSSWESTFVPYSGNMWDINTVRSAVDAFARRASTAQPRHVRQSAETTVAVNDYIDRILQFRPNPYMTAADFYYKLAAQYKVYNNAIAYPVFDETGRLTAVYPINAQYFELLEYMGTLYCRFTFATGATYICEYSRIIHVRRHFLEHDIFGDGNKPLDTALKTANTLNQSMSKFAELVAVIRGILKVSNAVKTEDLNRRRDDFIRDNLRMENNGAGVIVTDAKYDYIGLLYRGGGGIAHVLARRCDAQSRYGGARRGRFSERDNHGDDRFRRRVLYQAERVLRRPTSGYLARADGKAPRR